MKQLQSIWQPLIGALGLVVLIGMMCFVHTPSIGFIILMLINGIVFSILALSNEAPHSHIVNAVSLIMMWGISALGWDYVLCILPTAIMIINALLCGSYGLTMFCFFLLFAVFYVISQDNKELKIYKLPENSIEYVITEIQKRDHNDIMVVLEKSDKSITILPFDESVKDAWRLEKGDTISCNVYKNEIVSFEKK